MHLDSDTISPNTAIKTDICIVGAGVAGLIIANELKDAKRRITILESGDFAKNERAQHLNQGENVGYPYYPLDLARYRGVGGSSLRWNVDLGDKRGVRLRPMDAIDFEKREGVPYSGWPFSKTELDPYYARSQPYFGLTDQNYTGSHWQTEGDHEILPLESADLETTIFQFGDADLITTKHQSLLKKCQNLQIITNATVYEIETDPSGGFVTQLLVRNRANGVFRVLAEKYILATGGLEVPRLLLSSRHTQAHGIGNQNDLVGRFFMEHLHYLSGMWIPSSEQIFSKTGLYTMHRSRGTDVLAYLKLSPDVLKREHLLNYCVSFWPRPSFEGDSTANIVTSRGYHAIRKIKSELQEKRLPQSPGKRMGHIIGDTALLLEHFLRRRPGKEIQGTPVAFQLHQMSEQAPNPASRVTLSEERDCFGSFTAKLDWKISQSDIQTIRRAHEIIDREFQNAGLGKLTHGDFKKSPPAGITGGLHHMGTTRMDEDPKSGVVDSDCKIHGVDNLYVASSSVFPTVGYANPTLTIAALAIRLSDHLRKENIE
ncbi:MAG: GMC family oxidoreductase [Verrucomicrobiota bacterium]